MPKELLNSKVGQYCFNSTFNKIIFSKEKIINWLENLTDKVTFEIPIKDIESNIDKNATDLFLLKYPEYAQFVKESVQGTGQTNCDVIFRVIVNDQSYLFNYDYKTLIFKKVAFGKNHITLVNTVDNTEQAGDRFFSNIAKEFLLKERFLLQQNKDTSFIKGARELLDSFKDSTNKNYWLNTEERMYLFNTYF